MANFEPLDSAQLYRHYAVFVTRFMRRLGTPRDELDDLVQEVFLIAHRAGGYVPGPAAPTTFLASIAVRLLQTSRRKKRVRSIVENDEERVAESRDTVDPVRRFEDREELKRMGVALSRITTSKRAVLVRSDIDGESIPSIATGLGIKLNTAYSRLRMARQEFRQLVEER